MAFVEDDQTDIVDQARIIPEREIELLRRRDDNFARAQCVFIASGDATGAVEGGNLKSKGRERLTE